eukprot:365799-Chlamydomonas_euryale.AAC.9
MPDCGVPRVENLRSSRGRIQKRWGGCLQVWAEGKMPNCGVPRVENLRSGKRVSKNVGMHACKCGAVGSRADCMSASGKSGMDPGKFGRCMKPGSRALVRSRSRWSGWLIVSEMCLKPGSRALMQSCWPALLVGLESRVKVPEAWWKCRVKKPEALNLKVVWGAVRDS